MTAGTADGHPSRGAGPLTIVAVAVALLSILAGIVWWARRTPFRDGLAVLQATSPGDPLVLVERGLREDDLAALEAAARATRRPGYAAKWALRACDDEDAPPGERAAALALWREVEPANPMIDVVGAMAAIDSGGDGAPAAAERLERAIERGASSERPGLHGDVGADVHMALQRRLGTRDAAAVYVCAFGGTSAAHALRQATGFVVAGATLDAWEGRVERALARSAAARRFSERVLEAAREDVEALVACACADLAARAEARFALLAGDEERARRVVAGMNVRRRVVAEYTAGRYLPDPGGDLFEALDTLTTRRLSLRGEARRTWLHLQLKLSSERILEPLEAPEGTWAYQLARGRGATVTAEPRPIDVALETPGAFGPPATPDAPVPAPLLEHLRARPSRPGRAEIDMTEEIALPLAQYGARAAAAIEALPEGRWEDLGPSILPILARSGRPDVRRRLRDSIDGGVLYGAAAIVAAIRTLDDAEAAAALRREERHFRARGGEVLFARLATRDLALRAATATARETGGPSTPPGVDSGGRAPDLRALPPPGEPHPGKSSGKQVDSKAAGP